jgi:hypothetical protein
VLLDPPAPAPLAGRLQPLLAQLLVREPAERPAHDAIHGLLTGAYPAPLTAILGTPHGADPPAAEETTTTAVPGPVGCSERTMPFEAATAVAEVGRRDGDRRGGG